MSISLPNMDELLSQLEGFNVPVEALTALNEYVMLLALQSQIGQQELGMAQQQLGMEQVGLGREQVGLEQNKLQFEQEHMLPFRMEELENSRLLAELNLQMQQDRSQNQRLTSAEQLEQLRERGQYDSKLQSVGMQTALINLARDRERAAHESSMRGGSRRGQGQFTPGAAY